MAAIGQFLGHPARAAARPYGGVVADRVDKPRLMIVLQIAMGLQALALGLLTVLGAVRFWQVCALAVILGGPAVSCARACATRRALPRSPFRWR